MKRHWFLISICIFIFCYSFLIYWKLSPYSGAFSALIGIWEGFAEINPDIVDSGFVIFRDGGYDGQFFYYLAKSMFTDVSWDLIVDSYAFRLHRIGLTLFLGVPSYFFGFQFYPLIGAILPILVFLYSAKCLYNLFSDDKKYLTLFYIFSPFSLNSHLLLVADGFFTSLCLISIYHIFKKSNIYLITALLILTVFTREIGIFLIIPLLMESIYRRDLKSSSLYALPLLLFFVFLFLTRFFEPNHLGTNPLGFTDMIDYPLFGFYKSFFDSGHFHLTGKESTKLLLAFMWILSSLFCISLIQNIKANFQNYLWNYNNISLLLFPVCASLGVIFFAEEGYWRSFDNLSRMFTLILPLLLLISSQKRSVFIEIFQYSSLLLFFFLIIRILVITKVKDFYFSS